MPAKGAKVTGDLLSRLSIKERNRPLIDEDNDPTLRIERSADKVL